MHTPDNSTLSYPSDHTDNEMEIGYPIHVYFIELAKMYMQHIRWHWHNEIEIIIINFMTDDAKICLKAGQGILINQNVMHSIQPSTSDCNCSLYSAIFHPSFLFGYGNTLMSGKYLAPILSSPVFRTMFLDEQDSVSAQIMDLVNSVIAVNTTKKFGYELVTKAYLEDLSRSIHISKSECCRCFKRTLQVTPIEYLMKYRIFKAANMIQHDDPLSHSISELAFAVGFNNASYFNKVFRQYLKCTPSEYKRSTRNDPTGNPFHMISI